MRARKSLAERVMYCGGGAEVLGLVISDRVMGIGLEGSGGAEGKPEVLMLKLLVLWSVELKILEGVLVKLGLEAPQCAQL